MKIRWKEKITNVMAFLAIVAAWVAGPGCAGPANTGGGTVDRRSQRKREERLPSTIIRTNYHGWANSLVMRGGGTEVLIVPAIGRIMQFQFAGEPGPFWENRALDGQLHPPRATNWINFGGDKTWPMPEADWPKPYGGWLPPAAFDSQPVSVKIDRDQVTLISPVDPDYGIRVLRRVYFGPEPGKMTVWTRYEKVSGAARKVGVWTITQLQEPSGVFSPVPWPSRFAKGFHLLSQDAPPDLKVLTISNVPHKLVSLTRDSKSAYKIGLESGSLLWVGEKVMLRIDLPRNRYAEYPDHGSSAEIYTNPDPLPYVELEMLGPLLTMKVGDAIEWPNTYTLLRRSRPTPENEATALFGR